MYIIHGRYILLNNYFTIYYCYALILSVKKSRHHLQHLRVDQRRSVFAPQKIHVIETVEGHLEEANRRAMQFGEQQPHVLRKEIEEIPIFIEYSP